MNGPISQSLMTTGKVAMGKFSQYACVLKPKDQSPTSYIERMRKLLSPGTKRKLIQNGHKTFGVPLDELVRRAPPGEKIPRIVTTLCDYIQNNGIENEGIFRISGSVRVLERLKNSYDQTGEANLTEEDDVMAIAGLLKLFLRELPDSVVPESMTQPLIDLELGFEIKNEGYFEKILETLNKLPEENYNLLKYLLRFLVIVTQFEPSNKMSSTALSIVFGPNIFRCGYGIEGLRDQGITNKIVCTFINEYDRLFKDADEISPFSTKLIQVQGSTTQKTPPPRPPPPKIHAGEITAVPVAPPRKSKMRYDNSQCQDSEELNSSDDSHSGVGTPKSHTGSNPFLSPRVSEDESGRISPFVLDSENGHSIMDSPVVPVIASEIVEQTINQAISQYMFGYEGDASTTVSSVDEMTRDSLENGTPTPSPRLRKARPEDPVVDTEHKSSEEDERSVKVSQRVELFQQQKQQPVIDTSLVPTGTNSNRPKRQRPSSDAFEYFENRGILIGSKAPAKSESHETPSVVSAPHNSDYVITDVTDGVSTNSSLHLLFSNSQPQNKQLDTVDGDLRFQSDATDEKENTVDGRSQTLGSYKRAQGPKNRRSPTRKARKSLNLDELDSDIQEVLGDNDTTLENNSDNSHHHKQHQQRGHNYHSTNHYKPYPDHGDWSYKSQNGTHYNNNASHSTTSPDGHKKHVVPPLDFTNLHEQIDKSDPIPIEQNGVKEQQQNKPQGIVIPLVDSSDEDDLVQSSEERYRMTGVVLSPRTGIKFKKKSDPDELHQEAPLSPSAFKTSLTFSVPWNTDIAPSPPVDQGHYLKHSGPPAEEDIAAATKQIQRRIQFLKKTVKQFEDSFERENGCKPSHADKAANAEVKKNLVEITKAKKEIKKLKEEVGSRSRHSSGKSDDGSQDSGGSTTSIEKTLDLLLKRLKEKRQDACRPEDLTLMNTEQIQEEKLAVQKALLNFEGLHGRPASRKEKDLMRPLYDRYRTIKRLLAKPMSPRDELQTVPEDSPFELQPSTGHPGGKWDIRIPHGDEDDDDEAQEFGTSEFMVTRDMGLLRDTIRPITIVQKDSPKAKRKVLKETSDPGENIMGQTNLHELTVDELQDELQTAKQEKKKLRKVLKEFEDDFFRENGRKAQKEDRQPLSNEYFEYKQVKARLRLLEALLSKATPSSAV